jgi:hypothetical protein
MLGHLTLLGLKEQVMPWCSDGPDEAELGGTLETTLAHWADACRRQGGTVVIPHLPEPNGEPAALIATGRGDAVEMIRFGMYMHQEYYRYLNCGYRLPLVGGTDKMTADVPVGLYRTYVRIPNGEEFSYENWCHHLRAGRTFHSGGPIIDFTVDGHQIGDTISLPGNGGTMEVEATAESILPIHRLEIVQQGRVVAATEEAAGTRRLHLRARLPTTRRSWSGRSRKRWRRSTPACTGSASLTEPGRPRARLNVVGTGRSPRKEIDTATQRGCNNPSSPSRSPAQRNPMVPPRSNPAHISRNLALKLGGRGPPSAYHSEPRA